MTLNSSMTSETRCVDKKILNDGIKKEIWVNIYERIYALTEKVLALSNIEIYNLCFLPFEVE